MNGADYTWGCGCYSFCGNLVACPTHAPQKLALRDLFYPPYPTIDVGQFAYDTEEWVDDGGDSVRRKDEK